VIGLIALLAAGAAIAGQRQSSVAARIEVHANFAGPSGLGKFTFRGPFADNGSVDARFQVTRTQMRVVETLSGKNGTLKLQWRQPCKGGAGSWAILAGTGRYEGLTGGGPTTRAACHGRLASLHGIYSGNLKGYHASPVAPPAAVPPAAVPPAAPPPAPVPAAVPNGHYAGQTSQGASISFDVSGNGTSLSNLTISLVLELCEPPDMTLNADADGGAAGIAGDGSFSISLPSYSTMVGQTPAEADFSIEGKLTTSGTGAGTLNQGASFTTQQGAHYVCASGPVTWSVARTA
jgi:hypothetical protein